MTRCLVQLPPWCSLLCAAACCPMVLSVCCCLWSSAAWCLLLLAVRCCLLSSPVSFVLWLAFCALLVCRLMSAAACCLLQLAVWCDFMSAAPSRVLKLGGCCCLVSWSNAAIRVSTSSASMCEGRVGRISGHLCVEMFIRVCVCVCVCACVTVSSDVSVCVVVDSCMHTVYVCMQAQVVGEKTWSLLWTDVGVKKRKCGRVGMGKRRERGRT